MKKLYVFAAASAFLVSACGGAADEAAENVEVAAVEEVATECSQDDMIAKATEASEKMQALASDPAAMQEMVAEMQELQEKITTGAADGSFGTAEACAAYDTMLAS